MKKSRRKIIIAILCVIALWLLVGVVDFAMVRNYKKPLFCMGVDLADDGGSGKYVGLGYSFEIEGNFMPEVETPAVGADKPKVTSYKGYLLGKEVCRGFWEEMLPGPYASMNEVIEGDMPVVDELGMTEGDIVIEKPDKVTEPPKLLVVCGEEQITALRGTYSWEYSNEDGTCAGVEADSVHPLECKELMPDVDIVYATTSALHPRRAYLEFAIVPTEVEIRYWDEKDWNNTTAEIKSLDVLALEIDAADGSYSTDYIVELLEGNYIYEVTAEWSGSEDYSGTAYYSFYTVMGDYEIATVQE